jgi:hypothetical protein
MDNDPLFLVEWQGGTQVVWLASTRSYTAIAFGSPEFLSLHYFESASGEEERELSILCNASWLGIWTGHGIRI